MWIGTVCAGLGLLIAAVGIWVGLDERRSQREGRRARGRVTEVAVHVSSRRSGSHARDTG